MTVNRREFPPPRPNRVAQQQSRTHVIGEYEICKLERDVLVEDMRKLDGRDMEEFGRLKSSEKTTAIL